MAVECVGSSIVEIGNTVGRHDNKWLRTVSRTTVATVLVCNTVAILVYHISFQSSSFLLL